MKKRMVRQGDILVMSAPKSASKGMVPAPVDARGVVLAEGEATGHCHKITDPNVCLLRREGAGFDFDQILQVGAPSQLVHDEHSTIELSPGTYTVRRQREYDWLSASSLAVAD